MKSARAFAASPWAAIRASSEGVWTVPGQTALQRIPFPTKSAATDFVSPTTAAFVVPYTQRFGAPFTLDTTEAMFTMLPFPRSSMPGSTARIVRIIESRFKSREASQSSSDASSTVPWCTKPAQLKSTS
jgi:hypothetical protein